MGRYELVLWHELRLPAPSAAEARRRRILADKAPVPLRELDQRFQEFILDVRSRTVPVRIVPVDHEGGEPRYSKHGLVLTFDEAAMRRVYPQVVGAADTTRMHVYDRRDGTVMGVDTDPDIVVL